MLPLLVQGIAMATFFLAMITILLDGVPAHKIPLASGLSNFTRIVGGGFAASIVTTAVGPARGVASEPAGGPDHRLRTGVPSGVEDPA